MKTKLKLNLAHEAGEVLTREELKRVLGGTGSGSGSGCSIEFKCPDGKTTVSCYGDTLCRPFKNDKGVQIGVQCDEFTISSCTAQ